MVDLATLQKTFLDDIYNGTMQSLPYIEDKYHNRLSVYRNNTILTLIDLLTALYPVTTQLIGANYFRQVARAYATSMPQTNGNSHGYGAEFSKFLAQQVGMEKLAYVADVTAIEWSFFASSIAEDAPAFSAQHLQSNDIETDDFTLYVQPSVHLLELGSNALDIWTSHQGNEKDKIATLVQGDYHTLIWRASDSQVYMQNLDLSAYLFLSSCQKNEPLATALEKSSRDEDDIANLQKQFSQFLHNGIFTHPLKG